MAEIDIDETSILDKSKFKINILETKYDIYYDIARTMLSTLKKNNELGLSTSFILPVGPKGQYQRFARLCNAEKVSCKDLITINMDEFLTEGDRYIPMSHPLSFRSFMQKNLFELLNETNKVKPENIYFPDPENPEKIERLIQEIGSIDICFSGVGINGHVAFNEPDQDITVEKYLDLGTRVLEIARDTQIMTSLKYYGYIDMVPNRCITLGLKEIMRSKKINIYLEHNHQSMALRKIMLSKPDTGFPVTLLGFHNNTELFITKEVLKGLSYIEDKFFK